MGKVQLFFAFIGLQGVQVSTEVRVNFSESYIQVSKVH